MHIRACQKGRTPAIQKLPRHLPTSVMRLLALAILTAWGVPGVAGAAEPATAQSAAGAGGGRADAVASLESPLAPWKAGVTVSRVSPGAHHSIHTYYLTSPESPDGKSVLFYRSTTPEAYVGDVCIRDRANGAEKVLARDVNVEDAHRAACQQWTCGGSRVAFHDVLPDGEWCIKVADVGTGDVRIVARNRQIGFGRPTDEIIPLYGPHWNPGANTDMVLLNATTGEIQSTALTTDAVRAAYPAWVAKEFGDKPISVFFPVMSPDGRRVMFKLAASTGDHYRSGTASHRQGRLCYDLAEGKIVSMYPNWGHPAWHPAGEEILEMRGRLFDCDSAASQQLPGFPKGYGSPHPSFSPDGRLFTMDTRADNAEFGGETGSWAVIVGDVATGEYVKLHQFDHSRGAKSWRRSHPHPIFSPDGRRVYFNVGDGDWTQLCAAEVKTAR